MKQVSEARECDKQHAKFVSVQCGLRPYRFDRPLGIGLVGHSAVGWVGPRVLNIITRVLATMFIPSDNFMS